MGTVRVDSRLSFASAVQVQEELLRRGEPAVHVGEIDRAVLSYGVGVPDGAPYLGEAEALGLPIARRSSGGTGVLHLPRDLVWSVVLPRSDVRVGRHFVRGYARFGAGLVEALRTYGLAAAWTPAPALSDDFCPLGTRGEVLEVRGRVVGAAAQHLTGTTLLHHGTLSRTVDRELLRKIFRFSDPSVAERVAGVEEWEERLRAPSFAEEVATALGRALGPPWR